MPRKNSKKKGNRFELDIAKKLTEVFESEFRRTPNSGAYTGGKNRAKATLLREDAREILTGDIISPDGFPFLIECKHYKDRPSFYAMIHECDVILDNWLTQNEGDSKFINKEPLLFFKLNNKGTYFAIMDDTAFFKEEAKHINHIFYKNYLIFSYDNLQSVLDIPSIKKLI